VWRALEALLPRYCAACALALGLPLDFFSRAFQTLELCTVRYLHYPGLAEGGGIRAGEHTDFGMFTVLFVHGGEPGLQVKAVEGAAVGGRSGGEASGWLECALPRQHGAVVNTGALLARWTNDVWRATAHRVVVPRAPSTSRYTIACFLDPDGSAPVEAHPALVGKEGRRYGPISGAEFLRMKLREMSEGA